MEDATHFGALATEELIVEGPLLRGLLLDRRCFSRIRRTTISETGGAATWAEEEGEGSIIKVTDLDVDDRGSP